MKRAPGASAGDATLSALTAAVPPAVGTSRYAKVDRLALVADVTDPQTVTLQRVFAPTRVWGDQAPARWGQEHEAALRGSGR
jgi:hypothetical protein